MAKGNVSDNTTSPVIGYDGGDSSLSANVLQPIHLQYPNDSIICCVVLNDIPVFPSACCQVDPDWRNDARHHTVGSLVGTILHWQIIIHCITWCVLFEVDNYTTIFNCVRSYLLMGVTSANSIAYKRADLERKVCKCFMNGYLAHYVDSARSAFDYSSLVMSPQHSTHQQ